MRSSFLLILVVTTGCGPTRDPAEAKFVGSDVRRFWELYDEGRAGDLAGAMERYLSGGTQALKDYAKSRNVTAQNLAAQLQRTPRYYDSIRASSLAVIDDAELQEEVRAAYRVVEGWDAEATFPPVTFVIGRMNSGGTTSSAGILIGLELFSRAPDSPSDELDDFERVAIQPPDGLALLIAHEHVHITQGRNGVQGGDRLIDDAVMEGVADYFGSLSSGRPLESETYLYGRANEASLWAEFQRVMLGSEKSGWLYNLGRLQDRPGDLGYFMGHQIAAACAVSEPDLGALYRVLTSEPDGLRLLERCGYGA